MADDDTDHDRGADGDADRRLVAGWQGRFYEDFEIGDVYKHPYGRTVTETDNVWFTNLTAVAARKPTAVAVGGSAYATLHKPPKTTLPTLHRC